MPFPASLMRSLLSQALQKAVFQIRPARIDGHVTGEKSSERSYFSQNPSAAHQAVQEAREALRADQQEQALISVLAAIKHYPGWAPLYAELANVLHHSGQPEAARLAQNGSVDTDLWALHHDLIATESACAGETSWQRIVINETDQSEKTLSPPPTIDVQEHKAFALRTIKINPTFVDIIDHGYVWHDAHNTVVFDAHGRCIEEHSIGNQHVINTLRAQHSASYTGGRTFLLGARGISNYFHWMLDIFPKLELCRRAGITFQPDDRFVVPFLQRKFQHETLALWGISEQQIWAAHDESSYMHSEQWVVPYLHNHLATRLARWIPGYLRNSFLPTSAEIQQPRLRLFISRNAAGTQGRQVSNQAELDRFLKQYGFKLVYPEQHSVQEQAALFAQAAIVLAPHGAGLTNIVFCRQATVVIELFAAHIAPCYWVMSRIMGLEYRALACSVESGHSAGKADAAVSRQQRKQLGFSVELARLRALFVELGIAQAEMK